MAKTCEEYILDRLESVEKERKEAILEIEDLKGQIKALKDEEQFLFRVLRAYCFLTYNAKIIGGEINIDKSMFAHPLPSEFVKDFYEISSFMEDTVIIDDPITQKISLKKGGKLNGEGSSENK